MRRPGGSLWCALVWIGVLAVGGCSRGEPRADVRVAPTPVATRPVDEALLVLQDVMGWVVEPAAGVVFSAGGLRALPERRPATAQAWQAVADAADRLSEQAGLLMQPALAAERADWLSQALAMRRHAAEVIDAARAQDAERTAQASDALRAACQGCHLRYAAALAERVGEARLQP